ncbi:MAG: hypothetical protein HRT80_14880 [Henriciella sp.]|nr:hypothetical protein [Henriciella sp.]
MLRKNTRPSPNALPRTSEGKWLARSFALILTVLALPWILRAAVGLFEIFGAAHYSEDEGAVVQLFLMAFLTMLSFFGTSMLFTFVGRYGLLRLLTVRTMNKR